MFQQVQRADFQMAVCLTIYNNLKIYKYYNKKLYEKIITKHYITLHTWELLY